jgi:hypothetical protein
MHVKRGGDLILDFFWMCVGMARHDMDVKA